MSTSSRPCSRASRAHVPARDEAFRDLTAPLHTRATEAIEKGWYRHGTVQPSAVVASLALAWCGEPSPWSELPLAEVPLPPLLAELLMWRVHQVVRTQRAGRPRGLLSTPTHRGGWVDPAVLTARLADDPEPTELDLVATVLRLGHGRAPAALPTSRAGRVLAFALGLPVTEFPGEPGAWLAAALRRGDDGELAQTFPDLVGSPWRPANPPLAHFPGTGRGPLIPGPTWLRGDPRQGGVEPHVTLWHWALPSRHPRRADPHLYCQGQTYMPEHAALHLVAAWAEATAPAVPTLLSLATVEEMSPRLHAPYVEKAHARLIERLASPAHPWTPTCHVALAFALADPHADVHLPATEAFLTAAATGRLDVDVLSEAIGGILQAGGAPTGRYARSLGAALPHAAAAVRDVFLRALRPPRETWPRDLSKLLETLLQACTLAPPARLPDDARQLLSALPPRAKAGRLARQLLDHDTAS